MSTGTLQTASAQYKPPFKNYKYYLPPYKGYYINFIKIIIHLLGEAIYFKAFQLWQSSILLSMLCYRETDQTLMITK